MVCGGEEKVIFQEFSEFSSEGEGKLWASIGYNFGIETKVKVHFVEEEGSNSLSSDGFLHGTENYPP